MWKLTITQKRKAEYTDGTVDEIVVYFHKDIRVLTGLICSLYICENGTETSYKLERVGDK